MVDLGGLTNELWLDGDLRWKLDTLQASIHDQFQSLRAMLAWFNCSRQIGKSYLVTVLVLMFLIRHRLRFPKICRVYSATLTQVQDIVNDNMSKIMSDCPAGLVQRVRSENRWMIGRCSLRLGTMERAHVDKNRGGYSDLTAYEETGFLPSEDARYAIQSVAGPQLLRATGGAGREIHVSTPSEDEFHYLHTEVGPKCKALGSYFEYDVYKSPSISPGQIDQAIERCGGVDSESFQREYMCQIIRTQSRMLVPEFSMEYVREFDLPSHYEAILMIDSGGVRDKTGITIAVWDFKEQRLLFTNCAELPRGSSSTEIISAARFLENEIVWRSGDPNRWADLPGLTQIDFINEHKYFVRVPKKDHRDENIAQFRVDVSNGKVWVHPRCERLVSCLLKGRWDKNRRDIERTDEHGHADLAVSAVYAWRMIDRTTNPYPIEGIDRDRQMVIPYRSNPNELESIASSLVPIDFMKRAQGRRK